MPNHAGPDAASNGTGHVEVRARVLEAKLHLGPGIAGSMNESESRWIKLRTSFCAGNKSIRAQ